MLFQCVARPANGEGLKWRWGIPAGFLDWAWNRNRFSKVTRLDRLRESAAGGPYGRFSFQRRPSLPLHSKNKWDQSFSLFYFFYSLPPLNVQPQVVEQLRCIKMGKIDLWASIVWSYFFSMGILLFFPGSTSMSAHIMILVCLVLFNLTSRVT